MGSPRLLLTGSGRDGRTRCSFHFADVGAAGTVVMILRLEVSLESARGSYHRRCCLALAEVDIGSGGREGIAGRDRGIGVEAALE